MRPTPAMTTAARKTRIATCTRYLARKLPQMRPERFFFHFFFVAERDARLAADLSIQTKHCDERKDDTSFALTRSPPPPFAFLQSKQAVKNGRVLVCCPTNLTDRMILGALRSTAIAINHAASERSGSAFRYGTSLPARALGRYAGSLNLYGLAASLPSLVCAPQAHHMRFAQPSGSSVRAFTVLDPPDKAPDG